MSGRVEAIIPEEKNDTAFRHASSVGSRGWDGTQRITDANVCEMRQEIGVDYTQHVGAKHHLWGGFSLCNVSISNG